jgi:hypothetical protein
MERELGYGWWLLAYYRCQVSGVSKIAGKLGSLDARRLKNIIASGFLASQLSSLLAMSLEQMPDT